MMTNGPLTARRLLRLLTYVVVSLLLIVVSSSRALASGIIPPANPTADCDSTADNGSAWNVSSIDACRADEGVGPLVLPTNWSALTPVQQGFVLIDLERVNRGLPPVIGLSASLDAYAVRGAEAQTDPPFPSSGEGGGIWAGGSSILGDDMMWLYDDGRGGFDANEDCASTGTYCWGHRDIILGTDGGGPLVAGGGFIGSGGYGSLAYIIFTHYPTSGLTFTWSSELRYFPARPQDEPLGSAAASADQSAASAQAAANSEAAAATQRRNRHRRHHRARITITFG